MTVHRRGRAVGEGVGVGVGVGPGFAAGAALPAIAVPTACIVSPERCSSPPQRCSSPLSCGPIVRAASSITVFRSTRGLRPTSLP